MKQYVLAIILLITLSVSSLMSSAYVPNSYLQDSLLVDDSFLGFDFSREQLQPHLLVDIERQRKEDEKKREEEFEQLREYKTWIERYTQYINDMKSNANFSLVRLYSTFIKRETIMIEALNFFNEPQGLHLNQVGILNDRLQELRSIQATDGDEAVIYLNLARNAKYNDLVTAIDEECLFFDESKYTAMVRRIAHYLAIFQDRALSQPRFQVATPIELRSQRIDSQREGSSVRAIGFNPFSPKLGGQRIRTQKVSFVE